MLKNAGLSRITGLFFISVMAITLIGIASSPSDSFAGGSPGDTIPPPPVDPPGDTIVDPNLSPAGLDDPNPELPLQLEVMLAILELKL